MNAKTQPRTRLKLSCRLGLNNPTQKMTRHNTLENTRKRQHQPSHLTRCLTQEKEAKTQQTKQNTGLLNKNIQLNSVTTNNRLDSTKQTQTRSEAATRSELHKLRILDSVQKTGDSGQGFSTQYYYSASSDKTRIRERKRSNSTKYEHITRQCDSVK